MNYEICVIGSQALLFPFLQFGFKTFAPKNDHELRECVKRVVDDNYGIVYIEDSYCFKVKDILDKYRSSLTPIFIPIGENRGGENSNGDSFAGQTEKEMMERAIGINVL
jgi:vacuolar-type H+-ATPase subunit F/Vma7